MTDVKWQLEHLRDRARYLPERTRSRISWVGFVVFGVLAVVLEDVLTGTALTVFYGVALVLLGVILTLMWQNRESRR